ncbi:MAG: zinc ribbon domain-containing protein [Planctomycetes bacterium]|nr:zinc ribbon domain-containing protein [Planctomycetota bacterium]
MPSAITSATATRWLSCPRCSRRARAGQPFCDLCGQALLAEGAEQPTASRRTQACRGCGATVTVPEGERTAACAFCGTSYVAGREGAGGRPEPELVLPFSLGRREAEAAFAAWLGKAGWFVPGDLGLQSRLSSLRGVYVPFWSFSMRSESRWSARIGEHWWETVTETYTTTEHGKTVTRTRTRRVQHTEWYPLSGRFHQFHSHYLVSASRGLPQEVADRVGPFPLSEATRYAPRFLAGWLCEEAAVSREEAAEVSAREFERRERDDIARFLPGDTQADLAVETELHDVTEDLLLLPLWIFAYSYRGRAFRYVLNGATGKAHGEKPVSWGRVAAFVLVVILVLAALALAVLAAGGLARL